jgi:hypothetical protein
MADKAKIQRSGKAKWTFMVYMAGDNNLDGAALRDIAEMARAGSTKDVHVLVQLDRIEDKLTRRFRITQGGGFKKDCLESFGEANTGDPKVLYDFVKWSAERYPTDRYALILWNHGSGWWEDVKSRATGPARKKPRRQLFRHSLPQEHRSICYDDTSGGDALDNRGLKHSSCSQYVNEKGLSIDELQMLTDHARRDSVLQYASVQLEAKRRIIEKKIIPWGKLGGKISGDKT